MNTFPPDSSRTPRAWLIGVLVAVLTLLVYVPVVEGQFIWDDHQLILDAPRVQELRPLREYWGSAFWNRGDIEPEGRSYYRPLTIYSLALDYALNGKNASGYHIVNAVLHAANCVLLFALLRRRKLDNIQSALLALAWAWFPRLTEAAAWISGRTDVLAGFFVFFALLLSGRERPAARWASAGMLLFGLFAKEVAAAGLVAVAVNEWFSRRERSVKERLLSVVPVACSALIYAAARFWAMGHGVRTNGLNAKARLLVALEALGRYAAMLADGWHPDVQIGYLGAISWPHVALGAALLTAAGVWFWKRGRQLDAQGLSALALLVVALGLVLHIVPISVNIVAADRFMYLPLAAFVLLLAPLARRPLRSPVFAVVALVCVSFAVATFRQTRVWSDEVEFWTIQFRSKKKFNATARLELGNVYSRAGLHAYALSLFVSADSLDYYNFLLARHNAAMRLTIDGRFAEARAVLEQVVRDAPTVPKFRYSFAILCLAEHKLEEAEKHLSIAEKLYPDSTSTRRLRETIAKIRKLDAEPLPDESTTGGQLQMANRLAVLGRPKESLEKLIKASASPEITVNDLTQAVFYAFDWGSPRQLTALYKRYRELGGNSHVFADNYAMRMERVERLKALWPTLAKDAPPSAKSVESSARNATAEGAISP